VATPFALFPRLVSARCHFSCSYFENKTPETDHSRSDAAEKIGVLQQCGFVGFMFVMALRNAIAGIVSQNDLPVFPANDR
jgi:hypothetical protein